MKRLFNEFLHRPEIQDLPEIQEILLKYDGFIDIENCYLKKYDKYYEIIMTYRVPQQEFGLHKDRLIYGEITMSIFSGMPDKYIKICKKIRIANDRLPISTARGIVDPIEAQLKRLTHDYGGS